MSVYNLWIHFKVSYFLILQQETNYSKLQSILSNNSIIIFHISQLFPLILSPKSLHFFSKFIMFSIFDLKADLIMSAAILRWFVCLSLSFHRPCLCQALKSTLSDLITSGQLQACLFSPAANMYIHMHFNISTCDLISLPRLICKYTSA